MLVSTGPWVTPEEQAAKATGVYRTLRDAEIDREHTRTVLFGDMNMNPFETGMINFESGFASVPTRSLANRHSDEEFQGTQRFYNQRADKGLKAPPALGGSAMVARPTRPHIFAVN